MSVCKKRKRENLLLAMVFENSTKIAWLQSMPQSDDRHVRVKNDKMCVLCVCLDFTTSVSANSQSNC